MQANNEEKKEFKTDFVSQKTIDEESKEKKQIKEIDWDEWEEAKAGPKSHDLDILRTPTTTTEIKVPIDFIKKKFILFYIRELTVEEQLKMREEFYQFDQKSGKLTMNFLNYYRNIFRKMVKSSKPKIDWKDARFYNKKFMRIVQTYLPSPFEIEDIISENEEKNLEQLSEDTNIITKRQA